MLRRWRTIDAEPHFCDRAPAASRRDRSREVRRALGQPDARVRRRPPPADLAALHECAPNRLHRRWREMMQIANGAHRVANVVSGPLTRTSVIHRLMTPLRLIIFEREQDRLLKPSRLPPTHDREVYASSARHLELRRDHADLRGTVGFAPV